MFNKYTKTVLGAAALFFASDVWSQCEAEIAYSIGTGSYPSEISWQLNDASGATLFAGGAGEAGTWGLEPGSYTFLGADSYGDGWNGAIAQFFQFGELIGQLNVSGYSGSTTFNVEQVVDECGCISYFATNYAPTGPQNSFGCNYDDLQGLLLDGVSLDDLVASGVEDSDLIGLFAAGGIVVDVDRENKRALIGMALSYFLYDDDDDLSGNLRGDEFLDVAFSTELYSGAKNWDIIKRSYGTRYGTSTSSSTSGMSIVQSLGLVNVLGYDDWFVPNQEELQLYYNLYFSVGAQSLEWPVDPNGGSSSLSMSFPANTVTGYNWTSDIQNFGASETAVYRVIYGNSFGAPFESDLTGNSLERVIPMRIEYLDPPATVSNCSDWQYGDAGNQALSIGVPCLYPLFQCDSTESALWDELVIGAYPANTTVVEFGRDDTRDVLLNVPSTHEIDNNIYDVVGYEITSVSNVPVGLDVNLAPADVIEGGDVHCLEFTGTAMQEGIYDINVDGVLYLDILGSVLTTDITMTHQVVVTPNVTGIEGCAYPSADNYDPLATIDIGNCLFDGLCPGDFDNDGVIGIMDILHLLGLYDTTCD